MQSLAVLEVCFLTTILFSSDCSIAVRSCPATFTTTCRVCKATIWFIVCRIERPMHHKRDLQRRHAITTGITSGSIQCAYFVLENSPRSPLAGGRANAIPPRGTFESLPCQSRVARKSLSNLIALPKLIQKFDSDAVLLSNLIPQFSSARQKHDV